MLRLFLFIFFFHFFFFFNDTATTEIYTLSLHDALPILGWRYTSRSIRSSCCLAKSTSTTASVRVWKARSQAAYQGYSHLSGIEMMSSFTMCPHSRLRTVEAEVANGSTPCSSSHLLASKK